MASAHLRDRMAKSEENERQIAARRLGHILEEHGIARHRTATDTCICSYFGWHPDRLPHRPIYRLVDLDLSGWQDATRASYPAPVPTQSGPLAATADSSQQQKPI